MLDANRRMTTQRPGKKKVEHRSETKINGDGYAQGEEDGAGPNEHEIEKTNHTLALPVDTEVAWRAITTGSSRTRARGARAVAVCMWSVYWSVSIDGCEGEGERTVGGGGWGGGGRT